MLHETSGFLWKFIALENLIRELRVAFRKRYISNVLYTFSSYAVQFWTWKLQITWNSLVKFRFWFSWKITAMLRNKLSSRKFLVHDITSVMKEMHDLHVDSSSNRNSSAKIRVVRISRLNRVFAMPLRSDESACRFYFTKIEIRIRTRGIITRRDCQSLDSISSKYKFARTRR